MRALPIFAAVFAAIAVAAGALYLLGVFDPYLAASGLNYKACYRNGLGVTFCGREAHAYKEEVARLQRQRSAPVKPRPRPPAAVEPGPNGLAQIPGMAVRLRNYWSDRTTGDIDQPLRARGEFFFFEVGVRNDSASAQRLDAAGSQAVVRWHNRTYSEAVDATSATGDSLADKTSERPLQPGDQITGTLVFDIPADVARRLSWQDPGALVVAGFNSEPTDPMAQTATFGFSN